MKANELMIGDLVNIYVFPNENPKAEDLFPARISTIMTPLPSEHTGEHIECQFKSKDGGVGCASRPVETCRPIPLTPEILEKNGFEDVGDGIVQFFERPFYVWLSAQYELGIEMEETSFLEELGTKRILNMPCIYVHQLQHALRLCGIEKEIEL